VTRIVPLLPEAITDGIWKAFFEETDEIVGKPLESRFIKFCHRHNVDSMVAQFEGGLDSDSVELHGLLLRYAQLLGYHYDTGEITSKELYRYIEESTRFIPWQGTSAFLDFFGFVLDSSFQYDLLHYDPGSRDFKTAEEAESIPSAYPTPYVRFTADQNFFTTEEQRSLRANVQSLFYSMAPMDMVIESIVTNLESPPATAKFRSFPTTAIVEERGAFPTPEIHIGFSVTEASVLENADHVVPVRIGIGAHGLVATMEELPITDRD